jgi:hypothetical protein
MNIMLFPKRKNKAFQGCLCLFGLLALAACNPHLKQSPYKGYLTFANGLYYRYADFGSKEYRITKGQTMEVYVNFALMNDSVMWDSRGLWYPFSIMIPYYCIAMKAIV